MAKDNIYIMGKSKRKGNHNRMIMPKTTRKTSTYTYLFFCMWGFGNKNKQYSDDSTLIIDILTKSRRSCKHINRTPHWNSLIQKLLYTTIWIFFFGGGGGGLLYSKQWSSFDTLLSNFMIYSTLINFKFLHED